MPDFRLGRLKGEFVAVWNGPDGKRHRRKLGTSNPAQARAELNDLIELQREIERPRDKLTVEEIWADYVADRREEGKVSVGRMADAWKRLAPHFGGLRWSDVSPSVVRAYTAKRRKHGASDGTIHTELGYLRAALRRVLKGNAPAIALPSKPRPRSRYLTPNEARRLIDACTMPHVRLFVLLALHTAGRPSSILDLTWDRVDFARKTIALDDASRDRTAKGRATVPLASSLLAPLEDARTAALTSHVIEWAGKPVRSIKKAIGRTSARAGLENITPYVLRHTAAVWMAESGISMEEIAQFMGHSNTSVTFKTYARYSPEHLRRASDAISTVLHGTKNQREGE